MTTTDRPVEAARRRPDFLDGTAVVLTDGAAWHFRRPVVEFRIAETESGFEERLAVGDDGTFGRVMAERKRLLEAADTPEFQAGRVIALELAAGAALLRANYDLTLAEVAELMPFAYESPGDGDPGPDPTGAARIRNEVMGVARGDGPKP